MYNGKVIEFPFILLTVQQIRSTEPSISLVSSLTPGKILLNQRWQNIFSPFFAKIHH